jgi:hypothetical protein
MSRVAVVNDGIDGDSVRDMMLEAIECRFCTTKAPVPIQWCSDNGSPCIASAHDLGLVRRGAEWIVGHGLPPRLVPGILLPGKSCPVAEGEWPIASPCRTFGWRGK